MQWYLGIRLFLLSNILAYELSFEEIFVTKSSRYESNKTPSLEKNQ